MVNPNVVHVYPADDGMEHNTDSDECVCLPETEAVPRDDGSYGWLVTHRRMDQRSDR